MDSRHVLHVQVAQPTSNAATSSGVSPESLHAWLGLPSSIRRDVSMASLRSVYEPVGELAADTCFGGSATSSNDGDRSEFDFGASPPANEEDVSAKPTDDTEPNSHHNQPHQHPKWVKKSTTFVLCAVWLACVAIMAQNCGKQLAVKTLAVPRLGEKVHKLQRHASSEQFTISIRGSLQASNKINQQNHHQKQLLITLHANDELDVPLLPDIWTIALAPESDIDIVPQTTKSHFFDISNSNYTKSDNLSIRLQTTLNVDSAYELTYDATPPDNHWAPAQAAVILIMLYVVIILELVHRTLAALFASVASLAVLGYHSNMPSMNTIMQWIEVDTLLLLIAMMLLVAVLTETGVFDWLAVLVFRISHGRIWTLVHCLCLATVLLSAVLDNVSTVLLMAPVSIRLCEVMSLNPRPILTAIVMHANLGGAITPVGDPLSLMTFSNPVVRSSGITFISYTAQMGAGIAIVLVSTAAMMRFQYRDVKLLRMNVSLEYTQLWREIRVWKLAARRLSALSQNVRLVRQALVAKVRLLTGQLHTLERAMQQQPSGEFRYTLTELQQKYPIKNTVLLFKSSICLVLVLLLFIIQASATVQMLSLGWCALLGCILLLVLIDHADMDSLLHRLDWSTLLFLCCMFATMGGLERLGLIDWLVGGTNSLIDLVPAEAGGGGRLAVAILLVLWLTMLCSAFVDSYVVTAMMVRVVVALEQQEQQQQQLHPLPLQPIVWALAFGAALGSGGALYGSSANVVAACVAEQHGYRMSFVDYLRHCFPIVLLNTAVVSAYLLVVYVLCG